MRIGNLAARTGTNAPTIRYYESIGLLPRPPRQAGGQRIYGEDDVRRLTFIRRCRELGFSIEQVKTLASLMQDRDRWCLQARDLAKAHLSGIQAKLLGLQALERSITQLIGSCEASCLGGPGPDCAVFNDLAARPAAKPV